MADTPTLLERAIQIAVDAHRGDRGRDDLPYILHPLRVMERVRRFGDGVMTIGVLHDVVEKSEWTLDGLRRAGIPDPIVDAVDALTRRAEEERDGEDGYYRFVMRAAGNEIAALVKRADLEDNIATMLSLPEAERDEAKLARWRRALAIVREDEPLGWDAE